MADLLDRLAPALLDATLAASAIAGLVVLAMIQCRQPARRRDWARAGLVSTLALLPLAALNPVPRLDLRGPLRALLTTDLDGPPALPPGPTEERSPPVESPAGRGCPPSAASPGRVVARAAIGAYLAGVSIGLGWIGLGLAGAAWLVREARPASTGAVDLLGSLPFEGHPGPPRLLVSGWATRPVLVGWPGPTILIPPDYDRPGEGDRLRLGLLHELAHAEGLDHRFGPASTLAQALWFFLPPVWWIRDQMRLDQEFLADRRAVAHFGTSGGYASSLVELAGAPAPGRAEAPSPGAGRSAPGVGSALWQRVSMLVRCPFAIEGRAPRWWRWSTAGTLAFATIAASCLTLRGLADWPAPPESPSRPSARTFRLPDLAIGQREHDDQPFDLRFRLPDRFTLSFELTTEPADLSDIEVLGHRLGGPRRGDLAPKPGSPWHRVRIVRSGGAESVEVDGLPLAPEPGPSRLVPWLSIRPGPGRSARVKGLELAW